MIFFPWLTTVLASISCATVKKGEGELESNFNAMELTAHEMMANSKSSSGYFASYKLPMTGLVAGQYHAADAELVQLIQVLTASMKNMILLKRFPPWEFLMIFLQFPSLEKLPRRAKELKNLGSV